MGNMKFLIFGAGVLGSLYAARLHEAGIETALVARGQRYKDIKEHGIVLESFDTGDAGIALLSLHVERVFDSA